MLVSARACLEARGYVVVGAYLSPSHDAYVGPKAARLGTAAFSAALRLELTRRAVRDVPRVAVAAWEATRPGAAWPNFPDVCEALRDDLVAASSTKSGDDDAAKKEGIPAVVYVCGGDHAVKCGLLDAETRRHVAWCAAIVVVPRDDTDAASLVHHPEEDDDSAESSARLFVAAPAAGGVAGYSSTKVREALARRDARRLEAYLGSREAAAFLLDPSPEDRRTYAADFEMIDRLCVRGRRGRHTASCVL
mmetsp:Transcript_16671/g.67225  ORF Transcript_16671/g.67225 Transcript_16671/m.67225 type:complete len:249 (-) Transcript_16671:1448-2194(-)